MGARTVTVIPKPADRLDSLECRQLDAGHCRNLADDFAHQFASSDRTHADRGKPASTLVRPACWRYCRHPRPATPSDLLADLDAGDGSSAQHFEPYGRDWSMDTARAHAAAEHRRGDEQSGLAGDRP